MENMGSDAIHGKSIELVIDHVGPVFIAEKILLSHEPVYGLLWFLNIHGHDHNCVKTYREV